MKPILAWAVKRLKEPSTWAGLAGIVASMSFLPGAGADAAIVTAIGGAVCSVLAILVPEAK